MIGVLSMKGIFLKNMIKVRFLKIVCVVIVIALLVPAIVSCRKNESEVDNTETSDSIETNQGEFSGVPIPYTDDFEGYQFKVLTRGGGDWQSSDITADLTGNIVDQAVYTRNANLKNKYNFEIVEIKHDNWNEHARTIGEAGEAAYDMWSFTMRQMASLGQEGYLYNLNEVDGINLSAPYYDQNTVRDASFANYLFFLTGDLLTMDDIATTCTLVNSDIWDELKLDEEVGDIYELVTNKKWTFEKLKLCAQKATFISTGGSSMTKDDNWGGAAQTGHIANFYIAFGHDILQKNTDDTLYLNESDKLVSDLQEILGYLGGNEHYWRGDWGDLFKYGKQLFWYASIHEVPRMQDAGMDFFVVPNPLYDEGQESYHSYVTAYGSNCITICSTVKNIDLVASIIELASYESMNTVTPKFVEYVIGGRIIDNPEDAEMLQIVLDTQTYALTDLWSTGSIGNSLGTLLENKSTDVASAFAEARDSVTSSVQRKLERLNRLG